LNSVSVREFEHWEHLDAGCNTIIKGMGNNLDI
jgi:hypothetical protein